MPNSIHKRIKQSNVAPSKNSSEWVFYRAIVSMMGFLFLIQCLWASSAVVIFAGSTGLMCLGYGLFPRRFFR